jgi:hypothetical protein
MPVDLSRAGAAPKVSPPLAVAARPPPEEPRAISPGDVESQGCKLGPLT